MTIVRLLSWSTEGTKSTWGIDEMSPERKTVVYALLFVLDDPDRLDEVLAAWADIGVRGVTIMESTGWQRRRIRQALPGARFDFASLASGARQDNHVTLFVVVENQAIVRKALEAAEAIVGDLDQPHTGILVAWPLEIVKGLPHREATES